MESTADLQRRVTSALRAHGSFMILQQSGPRARRQPYEIYKTHCRLKPVVRLCGEVLFGSTGGPRGGLRVGLGFSTGDCVERGGVRQGYILVWAPATI